MKCFMCFKWEGLIFREELEVRAELLGYSLEYLVG